MTCFFGKKKFTHRTSHKTQKIHHWKNHCPCAWQKRSHMNMFLCYFIRCWMVMASTIVGPNPSCHGYGKSLANVFGGLCLCTHCPHLTAMMKIVPTKCRVELQMEPPIWRRRRRSSNQPLKCEGKFSMLEKGSKKHIILIHKEIDSKTIFPLHGFLNYETYSRYHNCPNQSIITNSLIFFWLGSKQFIMKLGEKVLNLSLV